MSDTKGDVMTLVEAIIDNLCGRSGFDAAFDVADDILADIEEEMADSIEAHLSAQSAMRVDEIAALRAENELYVEAFGQLIDQLENCNASLQLPMPNETHVKAMRALLPRFIETARVASGQKDD